MTDGRYLIRWSPTAKTDLRRLPQKIGTGVVEFVYGSLTAIPNASAASCTWNSLVSTQRVAATTG